jgi:hypothetical protein
MELKKRVCECTPDIIIVSTLFNLACIPNKGFHDEQCFARFPLWKGQCQSLRQPFTLLPPANSHAVCTDNLKEPTPDGIVSQTVVTPIAMSH